MGYPGNEIRRGPPESSQSYVSAQTTFIPVWNILHFPFFTSTLNTFPRIDADLYERFRSTFPDMKVDIINEDSMKSESGKAKWRPLLMEVFLLFG